jgi:adenylate cyclase
VETAEASGEIATVAGIADVEGPGVVSWLRGRRKAMPESMQKLLEDHRQKSERLVSWLQLGIAFLVGMYYLNSPGATPAGGSWRIALPLLVFYIAFAVGRLLLAGRNRINAAVEIASILLDVALIMAFVWSTKVEDLQPAASYLKSPTVLYVFVILALRTLTYSPWQVLLAGAAAVAGWTMLLMNAVSRSTEGVASPDIGTYETALAAYFGAELDKILAIIVVTVLLAFVSGRARLIMLRSLSEQNTATRLSQFFEPEVAQDIKETVVPMEPGQGRNVDCTAMFIDVKGFTGLAATQTPAEVLDLLARYHRLVVPIIHANHGSVSSYVGDGILATFGAFEGGHNNNTYAADALRTAEQTIEVFRRWQAEREARELPPIGIGIGIEAGPVIVGIVGEGSRLQYTVIGTAVNYASKFQAHTRKDNVTGVASNSCYELAQLQGYQAAVPLEVRREERVRGVGGQVDIVIFP